MENLTLTFTPEESGAILFAASAAKERLMELQKKYNGALDDIVNQYRPILEKFDADVIAYTKKKIETYPERYAHCKE